MTPEGLVKAAVKSVLDPLKPVLWYYMPVQSGYGRRVLDFVGCWRGQMFAVETKAPGGHLTKYQELTVTEMEMAGAKVFVVDGPGSLKELETWLIS